MKASILNNQKFMGILLSTPAIFLMLLLIFIPVTSAFILSFSDFALGDRSINWVGIKNYVKLFTRSSYQKVFDATFLYIVVVVPITIGLGLFCAILVQRAGRLSNFYRTIYFLPVMASMVAMAIVWEFFFDPTVGILNKTLSMGCDSTIIKFILGGKWYGLSDATSWYITSCESGFPNWIGDKKYAIWVVCFVGIWQGVGFNMVLYLAGLTGIPQHLYDAAKTDGVPAGWEQFRLIIWPLLGPTTVFVTTITLTNAFKIFDTVEVFFPQGSAKAKGTWVVMYAIYEKGVKQNLIGIGSAMTVLFLIAVVCITLIQRWYINRRVHY